MTAGDVYMVAGNGESGYSGDGGLATAAELGEPTGLAVDSSGDLFIADTSNNVIREVAATTGIQSGISMTDGDIYTVVGNGSSGYLGDGGPAVSAELNLYDGYGPTTGLAVDAIGNLYIADYGNDVVREVAAESGVQHGVAMTDGDIYTVVGNGTLGDSAKEVPPYQPSSMGQGKWLLTPRVTCLSTGMNRLPRYPLSRVTSLGSLSPRTIST